MVKLKTIQAEYVKEFIEQRKKVAAARKKRVDELDRLIQSLAPKLKEEYARGIKRTFKGYDNKMKMYDFLQLATPKDQPAAAVTQITVNLKPPRAPRREEILFSVDGTPIRI